MKNFMQDVRFALRSFLQAPGFTAAVLASLAIGIGANTALFSVTQALLLRPLPYSDAERLVILWNRSPGLNIAEDWFSTAQYFDIKNSTQSFEQVAIVFGFSENLTGDGNPERVSVRRVSSNLLPMLGARPQIGRLFTAEEDHAPPPKTALLTHGMWERRFGRDPNVLGKKLILNGATYEIVGVLSRDFSMPKEVVPTLYGDELTEIVLPFPMAEAAATVRTGEDYNILARLKPGVSVQQAQAEMDALTARLRRDHPDVYPPNGGLTFGIVPLHEQVVGSTRRPVLVLLGAVACVLLICCANVANLLLSRAVVRQKEIAVRQALGADRNRILQQLLTESVLLAVGGGLLGVILALAGVEALHLLGPRSVPRLQEIGVDFTALLFTFALAVFSGVLFGFAPALRLARLDLHNTLKDATRGASGMGAMWGRGHRLRRLLVVSQLALSVMLLIGAGLLLRSFSRLQAVNPGFNPAGVLTMGLTMTGQKYNAPEARIQFYRRLYEEIAKLPGVTSAGANAFMPMSDAFAWGPITIEGRTPLPGEQFINADIRIVSGRYFETMQIPLRAGRLFSEFDTAQTQPVAIIDEFMAEQMWPGQDPIGKRFKSGGANSEAPWYNVVGVVGRIKQYTLDADSRIAFYRPHTQAPRREMYLVIRSAQDPATLAGAIKQEVAKLDADLPLYSITTMESRVAQSLARRRFSMVLLGLFAIVALVLATLGIYGMLAYLVNQGTREIGIRMALGATREAITSLVVGHGLKLTLVGVGAGLAGAFALTQLLHSLLFGITARDPLTFSVIQLLLAAIALAASYLPARRAAQVDPMISLRWE